MTTAIHFTNNIQNKTEVQNETKEKEKRGSAYQFLITVLFESFCNQMEQTHTQLRMQQENTHLQEGLISQMSLLHLEELPKEAWERKKVPCKKGDPDSIEKIVDHWDRSGHWIEHTYYRWEVQLTHPEIFQPAQLRNDEVMRKTQDYQHDLSIAKQSSQLNFSSVTTSMRQSTTSSEMSTKMLKMETAIARRIARMK